MITTTYICDHCGHSQLDKNTPRQMWNIGILVGDSTYYTKTISGIPARLQAMWCRECCNTLQLITVSTQPPVPPPTMEDLLREIIREEIQESKQ